MSRKLIFIFCILMPLMTIASPINLNNIQISKGVEKNRIVLAFNHPTDYKFFTLSNPDRAVIDLKNTKLSVALSSINLVQTLVSKIRIGVQSGENLRLVFELKKPAALQVFSLKPQRNLSSRIVMDLKSDPKQKVSKVVNSSIMPKAKNPTVSKLRDIVVVIDPGHGGKDPGAMGASGTREKNVVLAIAQRLKELINEQPGMRAVLTRGSDYYIPLRTRLSITRKREADIFISIHADAYKERSSGGASVFALSEHGASSEAARWLAERENYSELGGVDLHDKSYMLRSVLIDLSQTATIGESLELGNNILSHLGKIGRLHNTRVEQAPFMVLKSPDIPSILIETGFISNSDEEEKLSNSRYRDKLAEAVLAGVRSYFWAHPPEGTFLAAERHSSKS
ncbi:MAG: N-acetylmuramoyl-L-alanine amidase [Proteobacteria bacterium]|nr:N-acetylmuramoyl-L-alanine amidase [Pseudomonadota bacterium]